MRRLRSIVEEKHDPCVDQRGMLGRHDDGGLVIGVVFGEVTDGFKDLRRLVRTEDIVPSPDLSWLDTYKDLTIKW